MYEEIYSLSNMVNNLGLNLHIAGISYCDETYRINRPNSEISCIEYIIKGKGTVMINGETFYPQEGDTYFLQQGKDQMYFSDKQDPWIKIWINVSGKLLDNMIKAYSLENKYYFPKLYTKDSFQSIIEIAKNKSLNSHLYCTNLIHDILYKISERVYSHGTFNSITHKAKIYMERNIDKNITLDDVAIHIGKSKSQLIRSFKETYGITPYSYFIGIKIELAKKLLKGSNMTVSQISEYLSFADEYYFSNIFKTKVGMSPKNFRSDLTQV